MQFIESNWRDIHRYYTNTFIKLNEAGDTLFHVDSVSAEKIELTDENSDPAVLYLHNSAPYDLTYVLPHKSTYQMGKYAYQMSRVPAKQYFRGIHQENVSIRRLAKGHWHNEEISFATLKPFVTKQPFLSINRAKREGLSTYMSIALSSRISVDMAVGMVYCDTVVIGMVDFAKPVITIHPLFMREMTALLLYTGDAHHYTLQVGK